MSSSNLGKNFKYLTPYTIGKEERDKKDCLYHVIPDYKTKFIVASSTPYFKFRAFNNHNEYIKFYTQFKKKAPYFYELIYGNKPHKFFLDIDFTHECDGEVDDLVNEMMCELIDICRGKWSLWTGQIEKSFNTNKDIIIYTSHGKILLEDGSNTNKRSFNIIFPTLIVADNYMAKYVFDDLKSKVDHIYHEFYDGSIYTSIRFFRMIGCTKFNKDRIYDRPKAVSEKWKFYNNSGEYEPYIPTLPSLSTPTDESKVSQENSDNIKNIKERRMITESLVSFVDKSMTNYYSCKLTPPVREKKVYNKRENINLPEEVPEPPTGLYYTDNDINDNEGFIYLHREFSSQCPVCNHGRNHDKIDGKLIWVPEQNRWILFCFQQHAYKKLCITWPLNNISGVNNNIKSNPIDLEEELAFLNI